MRYISVFSGIEAASVAWQPLGWEAVAFSEIEPFPCDLLSHYYPSVPNLGDISKIDWKEYHGKIDIVVGGSPCQSFSIAGQREGMGGASGLVREYFRFLQEVHPTWFVWENVPGVFSSNKGRDFPFIVSKWHELGYNVSWRVLDAQFFGVAQRRRRVFAVGHSGNWRYPAKVLFEQESLRGNTTKSRKKRQAHPGCTQASPSASGCNLYNGEVTGEIACSPIAPAIGASGPPYSRTGNERTEIEALVYQPVILKEKEGKPGGGKGPLYGDKSFTLNCSQDQTLIWQGVRRLTPLEAERLQGFQDGYTDIEFRGKHAVDSVRYKALGNSMCVNVMRWIGERIQKVEDGEF